MQFRCADFIEKRKIIEIGPLRFHASHWIVSCGKKGIEINQSRLLIKTFWVLISSIYAVVIQQEVQKVPMAFIFPSFDMLIPIA